MAGGKVVANLYLHSNVGTTTHFHNAVTKSVVPGDHISSTFTCDLGLGLGLGLGQKLKS